MSNTFFLYILKTSLGILVDDIPVFYLPIYSKYFDILIPCSAAVLETLTVEQR
jgi:hypothetical protein